MKVNGKLSKEQIDQYVLEKYNKLIRTFIVAMILITLIFVPITIGLDNNMAFFVLIIMLLVFIVCFIFIVKILRKNMKDYLIKNNKNYVYEFNESDLTIKKQEETKSYDYKKLGLIIMKSFYVIEINRKEKYIIPTDKLDKPDLKEIKKHFI